MADETHQPSALSSEVARNSADSTVETIDLSAWDLGHVQEKGPASAERLCAKLLSVNDASIETPNTHTSSTKTPLAQPN